MNLFIKNLEQIELRIRRRIPNPSKYWTCVEFEPEDVLPTGIV